VAAGSHAASDFPARWVDAFAETHVITVPGREVHLRRLLASLPIDPALVHVDFADRGVDCRTGLTESNHHVIVGERHRRLVADAAARGLRSVLVLEDDAEFVPDARPGGASFAALGRAIDWAGTHRDRWDVFYLGFLAPWLTGSALVAPGVIRPARPLLTQAIAYNASVFDAILAIDFRADHRPWLHRRVEAALRPDGRVEPYFRDGVGSIDSWLSYAPIRKYAAHPLAVVQHVPPPGTAESWTRRTGRPYDPYRTPRAQVSLSIATHYGVRTAVPAGAAAGLFWLFR